MTVARHPSEAGHAAAPPLPAHNVVAEFASMQEARVAIEALGRAGIDAAGISLSGPPAREAANREDTREIDAAIMRQFFWSSTEYAFVGALMGAVAAIPIAFVVFEWLGRDPSLSGLLVAALLGAFGGAWTAWAVGQAAPMERQAGESWGLTFAESASRNPFVGVRSQDFAIVERAETVLRVHSPLRMRRVRGGYSRPNPNRSR
jgi:hypothetical protein